MGLFFNFFLRYFIVSVYKHNWFVYVDFVSCNLTELIC